MILIVKLVAILLALISLAKSYLDYKKGLEPKIMFIFWCIVWIVATIIVTYPILIEKIDSYFKGGGFTLGSLTGVTFIFMLFLIYRVYAKSARVEYQLTQLVRKLSLKQPIKEEIE
jgi:hypothetical protein